MVLYMLCKIIGCLSFNTLIRHSSHKRMAQQQIVIPINPIEESKTLLAQPKIQYKLNHMDIPTIPEVQKSYHPYIDSEKEHASTTYSRTTRNYSKPRNMSAGGSKPYAPEEKEPSSLLNSMMDPHLEIYRLLSMKM